VKQRGRHQRLTGPGRLGWLDYYIMLKLVLFQCLLGDLMAVDSPRFHLACSGPSDRPHILKPLNGIGIVVFHQNYEVLQILCIFVCNHLQSEMFVALRPGLLKSVMINPQSIHIRERSNKHEFGRDRARSGHSVLLFNILRSFA